MLNYLKYFGLGYTILPVAYTWGMTHVVVIAGGSSAEKEVSTRSGTAVAAALKQAGYRVTSVDPAGHNEAELLGTIGSADVVFPVLHGIGGEDGVLQAVFDAHGICYVGSGPEASALCYDKNNYKKVVENLGITVPEGGLVEKAGFMASELTQRPFVLKPYDGGSSVDTFIVRDPKVIDRSQIDAALSKYGQMLLEELISGTELTVGVVGDTALPTVEIIPPENGEFDYENKYNGATRELCPPEHIDADTQDRAREIALNIHRSLGLRDMSRTDMILRESDNKLFVLETNTIPGMTDQSLLPKAAAAAGMPMPELVKTLVEAAVARRS